MEAYSRGTRFELTALGWRYVENRRLRKESNSQSEPTATALKERAESAISAALKGMEVHQPAIPVQ
jgi:hypothetical protein